MARTRGGAADPVVAAAGERGNLIRFFGQFCPEGAVFQTMILPPWTTATTAPKDPAILNDHLAEALALVAEARGHRSFARHVRHRGMGDLFRPLCQLAWHDKREWDLDTFRFWAAFPRVEKDEGMTDLFDTVCFMTPLGDMQDEDEADAYWLDLVATMRGFCQASLS